MTCYLYISQQDQHSSAERTVTTLEPGETQSLNFIDPTKEQELSIEANSRVDTGINATLLLFVCLSVCLSVCLFVCLFFVQIPDYKGAKWTGSLVMESSSGYRSHFRVKLRKSDNIGDYTKMVRKYL